MSYGDSKGKKRGKRKRPTPEESTSPIEFFIAHENPTLEDTLEELHSYPVYPNEMALEVRNLLCERICAFQKLRYLGRHFPFRCTVDENIINRGKSEILVHFLTPEAERYHMDDAWLCDTSRQEHSAMLLLGDILFKDALVEHLQFQKFFHIHLLHPPLPRPEMEALHQRSAETAQKLVQQMEQAVVSGRAVICGEVRELLGATAREKLLFFYTSLMEAAYPKLSLIQRPVKDKTAVWNILQGMDAYTLFEADHNKGNPAAQAELLQWLEEQFQAGVHPALDDVFRRYTSIPYGWLPLDVRAVLAYLAADQKIIVLADGTAVSSTDPNLPDMLCRKRTEELSLAPGRS